MPSAGPPLRHKMQLLFLLLYLATLYTRINGDCVACRNQAICKSCLQGTCDLNTNVDVLSHLQCICPLAPANHTVAMNPFMRSLEICINGAEITNCNDQNHVGFQEESSYIMNACTPYWASHPAPAMTVCNDGPASTSCTVYSSSIPRASPAVTLTASGSSTSASTPTSTAATSDAATSHPNGNAAAIKGGIVGGVVAGLVVIALAVWLWRRKASKKDEELRQPQRQEEEQAKELPPDSAFYEISGKSKPVELGALRPVELE